VTENVFFISENFCKENSVTSTDTWPQFSCIYMRTKSLYLPFTTSSIAIPLAQRFDHYDAICMTSVTKLVPVKFSMSNDL